MKQKLTPEEKAELKKEQSWWNKFLYSMKQKGALISAEVIEVTKEKKQTQLFT